MSGFSMPYIYGSAGCVPSFASDGSPITKAMSQAGLDATLYAGHNFRIGAVTSAARAGIEDSAHQDPLAHFSQSLAANT